jgi:hypothetical protein
MRGWMPRTVPLHSIFTDPLALKKRSQSSVEPTKSTGEHDRHDQDARAKDEHVLGLAEIEIPYTANQQVGNGEVEEPPEHVHGRRRKPFPWR